MWHSREKYLVIPRWYHTFCDKPSAYNLRKSRKIKNDTIDTTQIPLDLNSPPFL